MKRPNSQNHISWPDEIFEVIKGAAVRQVAYVPDAGHRRLIERCLTDPATRAIPLTTEEEGVALLAGAWLGGERGVLLMQSSGVGNCMNMLAMVQECRFPLLMLVTMRGEWGEFNPWQVPMGQATGRLLQEVGVIVQHVDDANRLAETINAAAHLTFDAYRAVAVVISQRIIGFKDWASTGGES
ncbi:MAG: phosphonopyruvate decarboxylase [Acidiferrobacterales bacterium]